MNQYDQQAKKFLQDTNSQIFIRFVGRRKHFDDKDTRNVYSVELKRTDDKGTRSMFIEFGDSLQNTWDDKKPRAYDVLACLTKYEPGTFEDFCGEFGYDTDSRRAEKTYKAVMKEWKELTYLYSDKELEQLAEIN